MRMDACGAHSCNLQVCSVSNSSILSLIIGIIPVLDNLSCDYHHCHCHALTNTIDMSTLWFKFFYATSVSLFF